MRRAILYALVCGTVTFALTYLLMWTVLTLAGVQ